MVTGIRVYGATDAGRARTSNEDYHADLVGDGCPAGIDALLIVADGLGGHTTGEVASRMVNHHHRLFVPRTKWARQSDQGDVLAPWTLRTNSQVPPHLR
jgi:serine/threonine protein phosphatase PrpC